MSIKKIMNVYFTQHLSRWTYYGQCIYTMTCNMEYSPNNILLEKLPTMHCGWHSLPWQPIYIEYARHTHPV